MRHTTVMKRFPNEDSANATCTTWDDLDGKELKFLGNARPAKRFLYFRFIITYIHCKKEGMQERTFKDFESTPGTDKATSRIIVAEDIYQAMIASNKEPPGNDNEEEEASNSDSDEPAFTDRIEFL
ncbi:unnamed protein product [Penicillium roqueforti FM164]|uniref:Genomic scaffold, ProqFM164S03 n=1 Tax=Penicillium roqueforti (strain FM164) TaxID=1365484 RepID=W6QF05_PENRF|nr:unnamed protein product [Penicillium roqueforti FM164]